MEEIILAIVGGRTYNNYNKFVEIVEQYIAEHGKPNIICSGGAKGIDTMAEMYANSHNIPTKIFIPDWKTYGKKAGILRNTDIVNYSTHILALPTKDSVGTYDTIRKANTLKKHLTIIDISWIA